MLILMANIYFYILFVQHCVSSCGMSLNGCAKKTKHNQSVQKNKGGLYSGPKKGGE